MSERNDHHEEEGVANHPVVTELFATLKAQLAQVAGIDTEFFVVGSGTPEQEAAYQTRLEELERETRERAAQYSRDHAVSAETWAALGRAFSQ